MMTEWGRLLEQARTLAPDELRRQAMIPAANSHECEECFVCACAHIYRERQRTGTFWNKRA